MLHVWIEDPDVLLRHEGCVCDRLLVRHFRVRSGVPDGEQDDDGKRGEDEPVR